MKVPIPALISACLGVGICGFGAAYMYNARMNQQIPTSPALELSISEFSLIDQNGEPADQSILDGNYTVAGFIFTNCPGLCPIMTRTMADAQTRLRGLDVQFVSFSLDAERDSPEAMVAFAETHGADLDNWILLTGDTAETRRIVREDLLLVVDDETDNQVPTADGGTMANILHPTRMLLIGPDRKVLGMYSVMDGSGVDTLEADLRQILGR